VGRLSDYVETIATATRTSARLIDVPQAIAVLPSQFLDDIGALDTKELYRHISGVADSPYSSTVVRGFTQREILVNGTRGNPYGSLEGDVNGSGFSTSQFRLTNVERVEVLKGPASVLYGSAEPGGAFNYVTKKPREQFEARASVGTGQYGQALAETEVTGPANTARTLLYRGALYFENRDSFRFNADTRNVHAVGGLTWKPGSSTSVALEFERIEQTNGAHRLRGIPVNAAGAFLTDYRWTATEPTDFTDLSANVLQLRWDHGFRSGVRLDSTFRFLAYDRHENYHEPRGITADGRFMQREFRDQLRTNDDWSWTFGVSGPVSLGRAGRHDIAIGADVLRQDHLFRFATARQQSAGGPVLPIALVDPQYGTANAATYGLTADRFATDLADSVRSGFYAQDLMSFGRRWHLLVGGRVDRYEDEGSSGGVPLAGSHTAGTGRAGLTFKALPTLSIYGSAATGFSRPAILSQSPSANGPHEPETSRQVEFGTKAEWLSGRVQFTTAFFHSVKEDVLRPDPALGPSGTNVNAVLSTGEVRNRGLELDLAGQVLPRWNLAFNYAYLDSTIRADVTRALVGRQMPNAAPHTAGVFTRIDLPAGVAVGGSAAFVDDREEPFAGIRAPGYVVVDAHYFQQVTPRIRLLFRVENLFDREYAASSLFAARAGNMPGQPRTVSVALTVSTRRAAMSAVP
jgi:iron complex outermembrane receptor protein